MLCHLAFQYRQQMNLALKNNVSCENINMIMWAIKHTPRYMRWKTQLAWSLKDSEGGCSTWKGSTSQSEGNWLTAGFSLGLNDRVQRPVVLFGALSFFLSALLFFLSALSFFQRPVIFRETFGFFGLSSASFWASSCRKRPIKAKGGAIFVNHVIRDGHGRHLGFTSQISAWEWGYANGIWSKLVRPVVFQD